MHRRAALRALLIGGGAGLLAACTPPAREMPTPATQTPGNPAPPWPTATPAPSPTPRPSPAAGPPPTATPDLAPAIEVAEQWFVLDEVIGVRDGPAGLPGMRAALHARVNGQVRAAALWDGTGWIANVPALAAPSDFHTPQEIDTMRGELAAQGYGIDLLLEAAGPGREGIVGVPQRGGVLLADCYGGLYELPRPADGQPAVRWMGRDWVGGHHPRGGAWEPALRTFVDGTEDCLEGFLLLTADDCNEYTDTLAMLDLLDEMGLTASFYPITSNVTRFPDLFRRMAAAGHEIGYHTSMHSRGDWKPDYLARDRAVFEQTVRDITGIPAYRVRTVRPPFGLWDFGGWQDWAASSGITTVMWGRSLGEDAWRGSIESYLAQYGSLILLSHPRPGDVGWLRRQKEWLRDLVARYHTGTVSAALLRQAHPLAIAGLPGEWAGPGQPPPAATAAAGPS
ncbi:MAG: hypothetical protein Kow00124_29510 [Anaerolineae bacterium]